MDVENPYVAAMGNIEWDDEFYEDSIELRLLDLKDKPRSGPTRNPIVEQLLTSNDEPKAAQIAAIEDIMQTQNATLPKLKAEILEVHSAVREMQAKRNALIEQEYALLAEMHRFKGVMSPIRRLPPEIIGEIFLYFAPSLKKDHRLREPLFYEHPASLTVERAEPPWHLGQICRYWRTVALSLRSLWSVFDLWPRGHDNSYTGYTDEPPSLSDSEDFEMSLPGIQVPDPSLASVENLLQRSTHAISCRMIYGDVDGSRTRFLCDALSACSRRLSHLCLVDFSQILLDRFCGSNAQYEQLRSLALIFDCSGWQRVVVFQCPPCLTELTLTCIRVTPATQASIPWAQLTKYCENDCIWEEEEDRWDAYRHLENAVDFCVQFPAYLDAPEDTVLIPKLQHARLRFEGGEYILGSFDFPVLQTLSYDHAEALRSVPFGQSFQLPGSLPHLKILRLRLKGYSASTSIAIRFRDILAGSPELSEIFIDLAGLQLDLCDITASLTASEVHPPLCPKLEVLRVGHGKMAFFDEIGGIEDMLRSRFGNCKNLARMRKFVLYGLDIPEYLCEEMIEVSAPYVEKGVDIHEGDLEDEHAFLEGHFCGSG